MKTKLSTNLLGKQTRVINGKYNPFGDFCVDGEPGKDLFEIVAVWIADNDTEPSATLRPLDSFGREKTGQLTNVLLRQLVLS